MRFHWSTRQSQQIQPYKRLAVIYDYVMRHVDYREWANYAKDLIQRWLPTTKTILDVACGTGNLLLELKQSNYQLLGCDASYYMILQAKNKKELEKIPLWQCNMTRFNLKKKLDTILCLYDSLNYIMNKDEILDFFNATYQVLNPNGILIFDICTEHNSLNFFSNYYDHEKNDDFSYYRWSHYDHKKKIQFTEFKLQFREELSTYLEVHRQRIYPINEIHRFIDSSPFELLDVYDGFSFLYPNYKSNRIHFVLQRKEKF